MTYSALIKLARIVNTDTQRDVDNGTTEADRYVQRGGLRLLDDTPLVVDHDMDRKVGVVHRLLEFDDSDGPWLWAKATVTDPPGWLKRGTRCSYGSIPVHRSAYGWMHSALVEEVSILSSAQTPVEPSARVAVLKRTESSSAAASKAATPAAGEVIHVPKVLVRRYFPAEFTVR